LGRNISGGSENQASKLFTEQIEMLIKTIRYQEMCASVFSFFFSRYTNNEISLQKSMQRDFLFFFFPLNMHKQREDIFKISDA